MLLLLIWIAVAVVVVVVLGSVAYGLLGAFQRLGRELATMDAELRPVLTDVQATAQRLAETAERRAATG